VSRPSVFLTRRLPPAVENVLAEQYRVVFAGAKEPGKAELIAAMAQHNALCCTVADRIDAEVIFAPARQATMIANYGVGFDHIDLAAAKDAGICVTNTPDVLTEATADLAIMLMLMASRRAGEGERQLRAGEWAGWEPRHMIGIGVQGRTLGLVGFGRIAQATAARATAFGMRIAYNSRRRASPDVEAKLGARFVPELRDLAAEADVLSLHCPGGAQTRHLIDAALLKAMKPTAILVNTARGSVVDEGALADALEAGTIFAAGLDVFENEPEVPTSLLAREDVVLLPHLGSATDLARTAMGMRMAANLRDYFAGREPRDRLA